MAMPKHITLMTQRIRIEQRENLHHKAEGNDPEDHGHRAYGIYEEAPQLITLDKGLRFERARETALHEQLHAVFAITQLDGLIEEGCGHGAGEHVVATLAPVILAWLRENPDMVSWLQEMQA